MNHETMEKFGQLADRYDSWLERHSAVFQSELRALQKVIPNSNIENTRKNIIENLSANEKKDYWNLGINSDILNTIIQDAQMQHMEKPDVGVPYNSYRPR